MDGEQGVGAIVLPPQEGADAHLLDVLFGGREHLIELGDEVFLFGLFDEVDDLVCVVEGLPARSVRRDLPLDGGDLTPDLLGALEILPDLGKFLLGTQFFQLFGAVIDVEGVFRLGEGLFERLDLESVIVCFEHIRLERSVCRDQ